MSVTLSVKCFAIKKSLLLKADLANFFSAKTAFF